MSDGRQNLTSTGYRKARKLASDHKRDLSRGHESEREAFLTKVLYKVDYILQDMYKKIKRSIKRSTDANAKTMIISKEWLIATYRHLCKFFKGFFWQSYTIGTPPLLLALLGSPNRTGYSNNDIVVTTHRVPKAGGRSKKPEQCRSSNQNKLEKGRRRNYD